ncbi:unnamed protein product [marine sediment metagenome]|uniref:Uncharacterized protein n=1 Tax=marine sediment metagenome TaxID=412755 RepID=X1NM34_9ZZZZ
MMRVLFDPENAESLGRIHKHLKSLSNSLDSMKSIGIPLHPGAIKFWEEQGLSIPPELVP